MGEHSWRAPTGRSLPETVARRSGFKRPACTSTRSFSGSVGARRPSNTGDMPATETSSLTLGLARFTLITALAGLALGCARDDSGGGDGGSGGAETGADGSGDAGDDGGSGGGMGDGGDGDDGGDDGDGDDGSDGDDGGEPAVPHALGTIVLGETHRADGGSSTPLVSASFIPDAAATGSGCSEEVAGCRVSTPADCGECADGEYCGFDDQCQASCLPVCDAVCGAGQVCYFPSPGQSGCRDVESFDAGALSFTGTTTAITLFPPYAYMGDTGGAPFVPGASIGVSASGATGAGFEAFDRMFTGTDLVQTNLDELNVGDFLDADSATITWPAGTDELTVTASIAGQMGQSGTIVCEADDTAGSFAFPRAAIDAVLGDDALSTASFSVTRRRVATHKDGVTKGMLLEATVQPVGWIDLITQSTESATVQVQSCEECLTSANENQCNAQAQACLDDAECPLYFQCLQAGNSFDFCDTEYPQGATVGDAVFACQCDVCDYECPGAEYCE